MSSIDHDRVVMYGCASLLVGFVIGMGVQCTSTASVPGPGDVTTYEAQQLACVALADSGTQATECRRIVKMTFCQAWPATASCPQDGGGQ